MKKLIITVAALAVVGFTSAAFATALVDVPMDVQINIGRTTDQSPTGDAMYLPPWNSLDTPEFRSDEPEGYYRHWLDGDGQANWWYNYVGFYLAGQANDYIDITSATTLEFDTRYFQDPVTNTSPYADAPVFVRIYTYAINAGTGEYDDYVGHRDFGIVQATQPPWSDPPYPTWTHVVIDINDPLVYVDEGAFDPTRVSRMRFWGTDWAGGGDDFVDFKNFVINLPGGPGDVDGNGVVDGLDLTAVLTAWETIPGDLLWNENADLDDNNVVNGLDLTEVISNWTVSS
jgi:hypothetical protein